MTEAFKASNGVDVSIGEESDGTFLVGKGGVIEGGVRRWTVATGNAEGIVALREFFQHERDQELGRWRWPENPGLMVYKDFDKTGKDTGMVRVTSEATGFGIGPFSRSVAKTGVYGEAARAYFAAHPEPKPLPSVPHTAWVDKYGTDIWWVDGFGKLRCCASPSSDPAKYAPFTRLVPEVSDDA